MCLSACVNTCEDGLDCVLASSHPKTPLMILSHHPKMLTESTRERKQGHRVSQWMYGNTATPHWCCYNYMTRFPSLAEARSRFKTTLVGLEKHLLAIKLILCCLLALSQPESDPTICSLSNLGTFSAASRDYTKYKIFSLHTREAAANPKCFCKQS